MKLHINKKYYWILPVLLAAICNITALTNQFVWDDAIIIDDLIPRLNTIGDAFFKKGVLQAGTSYYRPLIHVSYIIADRLGGTSPLWYHATVWFYHIVATLLLFFLARFLLRRFPFSNKAALLAASIFAIHPAHAEVVGWMSGVNDALLTLFSFGALLSALMYLDRSKLYLLILFALSFAGALFTKEPAIGLLPLVLLLPILSPPEECPARLRIIPLFACMGLVFAIYLYFRLSFLGSSGVLGLALSPWKAVTNVFLSYAFYLQKFIVPLDISYYIAVVPSNVPLFILFGVSVAAFVVFAFLEGKRRDKIATFCISFFILTIAPAMTVVFCKYSETPLAIRYLYLPSAGLCILAAYLFYESETLFTGAKLRIYQILKGGVAIIIMISLIVLNFKGVAAWHDTITFWEDAISKTPDEGLPHHELGHAYQKLGRLQDAKRQYELALTSLYDNEGRGYASNNLGAIYLSLGDRQKAMELFRQATGFVHSYYTPHFNLGYILYEDARAAKTKEERDALLTMSLQELKTAVELYAYGAKEFFYLGEAYRLKGEDENARAAYEAAIQVGENTEWGRLANERLGLWEVPN